ncbi:uncharacterized protein LOC132543008 [Ylistrum balloti]|uniref:uncharacterized protein LOC132543008 n=1 Tax=Ylistrum balloti TaxID=509963 RepID=UPI002905F782|nr:uncharacterized protein LOC132543008 [Ylistrum balloti]
MFPTLRISPTSMVVLGLCIASVRSSEVHRCPSDLTGTMYTHNGQCYRYVNSRVTWDVARADCSSRNGGHLVVILDRSTQDFISSLQFPKYTQQVWIGFSDRKREQAWTWVTGDVRTFKFWAIGNPVLCFGNNVLCPEDCAYLRTSDGRWIEDKCNDVHVKYQYICQYDMSSTTTSPTTTTSIITTMLATPATTPYQTTTTTTSTAMPSTTTKTPSTTKTKKSLPLTSKTVTPVSLTTTHASTTGSPVAGGTGQLLDEDKALSKGGLVGLVLALVVVLGVIAVVLLVIIRKRNRRKRYEEDDIPVRFENRTYDTNRPPNLFVDEQTVISNGLRSTENIYATPAPKPCNNRVLHQNAYDIPDNCDVSAGHYDTVKDCDMIDLDVDKNGAYTTNGDMEDSTYSDTKPKKGTGLEVFENRTNDELLKCFEKFNKAPTAYNNNLYSGDSNG